MEDPTQDRQLNIRINNDVLHMLNQLVKVNPLYETQSHAIRVAIIKLYNAEQRERMARTIEHLKL